MGKNKKKLAKIETVTRAAQKIIPRYLGTGDSNDAAVALFVASSFLEVRLETVLRHYFKLRGRGTKELYDEIGLKRLVRMAYALEIINKSDHDEFLNLANRRNTLGHETEGYREWGENDANINRRLANRALEFVKANGTKARIRTRLSAVPLIALRRTKDGQDLGKLGEGRPL